jgi:hypothetical protein
MILFVIDSQTLATKDVKLILDFTCTLDVKLICQLILDFTCTLDCQTDLPADFRFYLYICIILGYCLIIDLHFYHSIVEDHRYLCFSLFILL